MTTGLGAFGSARFGFGYDADPMTNLGFELGTNGRASRWRSANFTQSAFSAAEFRSGEALESFESGWGAQPFAFDEDDLNTFGDFVPLGPETFEVLWSNTPYLHDLGGTEIAVFQAASLFGPKAESFAFGWQNDQYRTTFESADPFAYILTSDGLTATNYDAFYIPISKFSFAPGDLTAASFSGVRAQAFENFSALDGASYQSFSATDQLGLTATAGLVVGHRVVLSTPVGGSISTPLMPGIAYYVQTIVDAANFKVSLTSGGSAIDLTTNSSGVNTWKAPYENWVTRMSTLP